MKFCPECCFLLHYHETDGVLYNNCKNCGYDEKSDETVISTSIYKKNIIENTKLSKYSIHDNALLHTIHYVCPNKNCDTPKNKELKDAVLYNKDDLQIVYICTVCKSEWI